MKVLIYTYDLAFQNISGGVHNRIIALVDALRKNGITVDYYNRFCSRICDYDILHVFMLQPDAYEIVNYAKSKGLKIVISSICMMNQKFTVDFYRFIRRLPLATVYQKTFMMVRYADAIITESNQEAEFLFKHYGAKKSQLIRIQNGADVFKDNGEKEIYKYTNKREYAIVNGRFDENKNQLELIKAMKKSEVVIVFVGGPGAGSKKYYEKCLDEAKDEVSFIFLGWLPHDSALLASAVNNAKVVICPSYKETFGLSIAEGLAAGSIPVVSKSLSILEYDIMRLCLQFDPKDRKDIREKVLQAMEMEKNLIDPNDAKLFFDWNTVAMLHIDLYKRLL